MLGIVEGAKEDKVVYSQLLSHLKECSLKDVELFISDTCLGLVESLGEFYPETRWQRCIVHFYRNIFSFVPKGKVQDLALMLKAIHVMRKKIKKRPNKKLRKCMKN